MGQQRTVSLTETQLIKAAAQHHKGTEAALGKFEKILDAGGQPTIFHVIAGDYWVEDALAIPPTVVPKLSIRQEETTEQEGRR